MRVTFLLPHGGRLPGGGLRVVYEYADRLAGRGHQVAVVHPAHMRQKGGSRLRAWARFVARRLNHSYRPSRWFPFRHGVKLIWVPELRERFIPDADAVVATAWQTADYANELSDRKGRKFYLVQGYETWDNEEAPVLNTWRFPMQKIAISRWLQRLIAAQGETAVFIPNGIDTDVFRCLTDPGERDGRTILFIYAEMPLKGSHDAIAALEEARNRLGHVRVLSFGLMPDAKLPAWCEYSYNPSREKIIALYNEAAIFIAPSRQEGWGLPACEAMACGAAVVATDIGGHREFAVDGETALLVPPEDPAALAEAICRLVVDQDLRIRLARAGNAAIQRFGWDRSVAEFERVLLAGGTVAATGAPRGERRVAASKLSARSL